MSTQVIQNSDVFAQIDDRVRSLCEIMNADDHWHTNDEATIIGNEISSLFEPIIGRVVDEMNRVDQENRAKFLEYEANFPKCEDDFPENTLSTGVC